MCICGVARPLYFRASLASNPFIWLRLFSAVGRRSIFSAETSAASWRSRSREGNVGKREEAQLRSTFSKAEMELVYRHDDRQGRVCGLVAAYALRDKVCLTAIGQLAAKDLLPSQTPVSQTLMNFSPSKSLDRSKWKFANESLQDFLCLYTQEGRLEEAATVVSFLCQASEFSAALTGSESPLLKVGLFLTREDRGDCQRVSDVKSSFYLSVSSGRDRAVGRLLFPAALQRAYSRRSEFAELEFTKAHVPLRNCN